MSTVLEIRTEPERLRKTNWQEYAIRFLFGGIVASVVGVLAQAWGRVVAGLFLAFPAILPASLTLIESHEGKKPAGTHAFGAALGSIGLMTFAGIVWAFATRAPAWIVLAGAGLSWLAVSMAAWGLSRN